MKNFYFKIFIASLLFLGSSSLVSCSDDDQNEIETIITVNDLPPSAKSFLDKYFNGYSIIKIEKEVEDNLTLYKVNLQDGYEVIFNSDGDWVQVEAPYGKNIPTGFIPQQVMATLNQRFPDYGLTEINTTGQGYKVELSDNQGGTSLDVYFDMAGEIIKIDQMDY